MGARKNQTFDFKVNVDFVTKAQKDWILMFLI